MNRFPMSRAAAALLHALISRSPIDRDRILLTHCKSTDWQSLTFIGERHELQFRIQGPDADIAYRALTGDLADAEFAIPKQLLAEIAVFGAPSHEADGSILFGIEALTIVSD